MTSAQNEPVRSLYADDPEFKELLESYVSSMKEKIEVCQSARENKKHDELKVLTHQIKGSGTGYGFPEVSQLASEAEEEYIQGNHEVADDKLHSLLRYLQRIEL